MSNITPNDQPKLILIRALKRILAGDRDPQMTAYKALGGRIENGNLIDLEDLK